MQVVKRNVMPDGTHIQIEKWDDLKIAAYPKAKNTGKYQWVRKGETFRLELSRGFNNDNEVEELFQQLVSGVCKLEDLDDRYWDGEKARYYMGLRDTEPSM